MTTTAPTSTSNGSDAKGTTTTTIKSATSKVYFHKRGDTYKLAPKVSLDLHEKLPPKTYAVAVDPCDGSYFLQTIESFSINHKIYGDTKRQADRILNTFLDRNDSSTGVLLVGEKGAGKTLLAKHISISGASMMRAANGDSSSSTTEEASANEDGIPTIVVNQPHTGEKFNQFLQRIEQPKIVLFDEFEKVYKDQQEHLLTLLDGTYPSKTLFLLTCNDKYAVNSHMMNRPGRIYYLMEFKGISQSFVKEYCEDNLVTKEHIPAVCAVAALFLNFNFDMLKAMVEEMNRYGETPGQVIKYLNARPDFGGTKTYKLELTIPNKELLTENLWRGTPLSSVVAITYVEVPEKGDDDADKGLSERQKQRNHRHKFHQLPQERMNFNPRHLQVFDAAKGEYKFYDSENKATLVLKEQKAISYSLDFGKIGTKLHSNKTKGGAASPTGTDSTSAADDENDDGDALALEAVQDACYGDY
mmetsp:Transcript_45785/g.68126  ORF Transcript_45785/g.68126 Transcript_45785/m.68126 type:complete len:472 (-) Transcript_45785:153-1568(-)